MLKRNTGLEVLDLRNNRLSKAGIAAIAEAIQVWAPPLPGLLMTASLEE